MAKAILIMDMPSRCIECPLLASWQDSASAPRNYWCPYNLEITIEVEKRSEWCPLREVPQKKVIHCTDTMHHRHAKDGYNACIDEILGGWRVMEQMELLIIALKRIKEECEKHCYTM